MPYDPSRITVALILLGLGNSSLHGQEIQGGTWTTDANYSLWAGDAVGGNAFGIPDCNSDGIPDMAQSVNQSLNLADGTDGSLIVNLDFQHLGINPVIAYAGDYDLDGIPDFFVQSINRQEPLYILSGHSGSVIGSYPPIIDTGTYKPTNPGDLDADGFPDILLYNDSAGQGFLHYGSVIALSSVTGNELYRLAGSFPEERFGGNAVGIPDQDGDGHADFLASSSGLHSASHHDGYVRLFSGVDGTVLWEIPNPEVNAEFGWTTLATADNLDGDGALDLLASCSGEIIAFSLLTRFEIRRYDSSRSVPIFDFNGDGINEIHAQFPVGKILDGHTGLSLYEGHPSYEVLDTTPVSGKPTLLVYQGTYPNDSVGLRTFEPHLSADGIGISTSSGGTVQFEVDFGSLYVGRSYALILSGSGVGPTVLGGIQVPVMMDSFTIACITNDYPQAFLAPRGTLDSSGRAQCGIQLQPGQYAGAAGRTITVAAGLFVNGIMTRSSTAQHIELLP